MVDTSGWQANPTHWDDEPARILSDDEMDVIVRRAHANALDNGYGEEMRGWTTYEHAIDLGDTEPDLEGQDVFRIEAAVKRMFGFDYDEKDVPR